MNDIWGPDNLENELTGELTLVVPGVFKLLEYKSLSMNYHVLPHPGCARACLASEWWAELPCCSGGCPGAIREGSALSASSPSHRLIWLGSQPIFLLFPGGVLWEVAKHWAADSYLFYEKMCLVSGTNKLKSKAIIPIGNNHTCAKHVYNLLSLSVSY